MARLPGLVAASICLLSLASAAAEDEGGRWRDLSMNNMQWRFVEGAWTQNEDGLIEAPADLGRNVAVFTEHAYGDFEAEFEFRWELPWTSAGFVFRATDPQHYYILHFPVVGQHYRIEHFWAAISKVDASGFTKVIGRKRMEMVGGVASEIGLWHKVRLVVKGPEIRAWVDGRPLLPVVDDSYGQPGYVGLSTYASLAAGAKSTFRNLRIRGKQADAAAWDGSLEPVKNWFVVSDSEGSSCGRITRGGNGDLLVTLGGVLARSVDNGRTWTHEPLDDSGGLLYTAADGQLHRFRIAVKTPHTISRATSTDDGKTWGAFESIGHVDAENLINIYEGPLVERRDGGLLWFMIIHTKTNDGGFVGGTYCLRSTDGGVTWSPPVHVDGANPRPKYGVRKNVNSEPAAAETRDGRVVCFVRNSQPTMWECWSDDGGVTWRPAARGPFAMYAGQHSMVRTASGALVFGARFPGIGVRVSHDDGMTWQCTEIDAATWANGAMYEVEPNVVLFIYGGPDSPRQMRAQLLRVTAAGLEAVKD